jgi:hypothetical protein
MTEMLQGKVAWLASGTPLAAIPGGAVSQSR